MLDTNQSAQDYATSNQFFDNIEEMINTVGEDDREDHSLISIQDGSVVQTGVLAPGASAECSQYLAAVNNLA